VATNVSEERIASVSFYNSLKMEAIGSSETFVTTYKITQSHILEDDSPSLNCNLGQRHFRTEVNVNALWIDVVVSNPATAAIQMESAQYTCE
jgi:hypothetical protein